MNEQADHYEEELIKTQESLCKGCLEKAELDHCLLSFKDQSACLQETGNEVLNIYTLMKVTQKALREQGKNALAHELIQRVFSAGSKDSALTIIKEYIE